MINRKHTLLLPLTLLVMFLSGSCQNKAIVYEGPDYIGFSDSLQVLPVVDSEEYLDIEVSATQVADHDRIFAVEVIDEESNAIEGVHYRLQSNTITIKAGERASSVKAVGIFDNLEPSDSLVFCLRLVTDEAKEWELYNNETHVLLRKYCPYDINNFVGPCLVVSQYIKDYFPPLSKPQRLTESVLGEEENTIIIKDYFYDGYDFKLRFNQDDPYHPFIEFDDQIFARTEDAFSNIFGDGKIHISEPAGADSFYSNCENFLIHYMMLRVYNDGSDKVHDAFFAQNHGIVGVFTNMIDWISDAEAEKYRKLGY